MSITYIIIIVLVAVLLWVVGTFNILIRMRNRTKEAWADIDVQLKRRYDLIPNLVEIVKGYAVHEKQLFENVTEARTKAMGAQGIKDKAGAENMLSDTLKSLFAVSENYPDLKASTNFLELQKELTDAEDKIQAARRFYNSNVMELNTKIESFPSNTIASAFSFKQAELFEIAEPSQREPVKVNF